MAHLSPPPSPPVIQSQKYPIMGHLSIEKNTLPLMEKSQFAATFAHKWNTRGLFASHESVTHKHCHILSVFKRETIFRYLNFVQSVALFESIFLAASISSVFAWCIAISTKITADQRLCIDSRERRSNW